jgi:hypothetical protein
LIEDYGDRTGFMWGKGRVIEGSCGVRKGFYRFMWGKERVIEGSCGVREGFYGF